MKKFLLIGLITIGFLVSTFVSNAGGLVINMRPPTPVVVYHTVPQAIYQTTSVYVVPQAVYYPAPVVVYQSSPVYYYHPRPVISFGFSFGNRHRHHHGWNRR